MGVVDHDEIVRLYGPWRHRTPPDVAELFSGYTGDWWIAGGWAIEAFTNLPRTHGDVDPSIPRAEASLLRAHLSGRLDVWAADKGALRPLVTPEASIPATCNNLWLRESGTSPWEYDVILMDTTAERWTYRRDPRISLPFSDVLWERDGIRYLRPEIQLLHKAPALRPQDQGDFEACLPLLDFAGRTWLRTALQIAHPGHPWIDALS